MRGSNRLTAEEQFKAAQKKTEKAKTEKEEADQVRAEKIGSLRARRLAQAAQDKKTAAAKPRKG